MANQFLAGLHPVLNKMGVWATPSGVDVLTATDDQFILSPDYNMLQIYKSGFVALGPGLYADVPFPVALGGPCYVYYYTSADPSIVMYPFWESLRPTQATQQLVVCILFGTYFRFGNTTENNQYVQYTVFKRRLGT